MINTSTKDYIVIKENQYQDIETLKYNFLSFPSVRKKWGLLAYTLGFWGANGYDTKIIGENMNLTKSDSNYILQGKLDPTKSEPRVKIIFSNFKFEFLPETISTKESITTDLTPEIITSTQFINKNVSEATISKKFRFSISNTTSNYSSNIISNSIGLRHAFTFKAPGITQENEISYTFSHEYTLGSQTDETFSKEVEDEFSISVPPESKIPIKILSYKNKVKTPYIAFTKISFNITLDGFLKKNKHPYLKNLTYIRTQPDYGYLSYTFGNEDISALEDLNSQFIRKDIPDGSDWDWNLLLSSKNPRIKNSLNNLSKEYVAEISGEFNRVNSSNTIIEAGNSIPL